VLYREAHMLIEEVHQARELGELKKYRSQLQAADLLVIDDLFLRRLPPSAGEELADVLMSRYEKLSMQDFAFGYHPISRVGTHLKGVLAEP
jgi:DNA replication protein DnaC